MRSLKNRDIRVIAFDLDGTLLRDDKSISERSGRILSEAALSGRIIVPVTGRPLPGVPRDVLSISGLRYVISSNGAVTTDVTSGVTVREALIDPGRALEIVGVLMREGCLYSVFSGGYGYSDPGTLERIKDHYCASPLFGYILKTRKGTEDMERILRKFCGAENIWIMAGDSKQRDMLSELVASPGELRTVKASDRELEIGSDSADKGLALRDLCGMLGEDCGRTLAFGDSDNDRGLKDVGGIFAAVGNASAELKAMADLITPSNNDDGPAEVVEKLLKDPGASLLDF